MSKGEIYFGGGPTDADRKVRIINPSKINVPNDCLIRLISHCIKNIVFLYVNEENVKTLRILEIDTL